MRIGVFCAAAMFVALGGSGVSVTAGVALMAIAIIGGHALSEKLDAIARESDRD